MSSTFALGSCLKFWVATDDVWVEDVRYFRRSCVDYSLDLVAPQQRGFTGSQAVTDEQTFTNLNRPTESDSRKVDLLLCEALV